MNITIRPMREDEIEHIVTVHEKTAVVAYAHIFGDTPFPRQDTIERWEAFPDKVDVAEADGKIVGFAAYDDTELHALYVLPSYQGCGIGTRLLERVRDVSQVWVLRDNYAARKFYEARGWQPTDARREEYGQVLLQYEKASMQP